jgi:hypothetical protein
VYNKANINLNCGKDYLRFAQLMGGYDIENPRQIYAYGKTNDGKTDYNNQILVDWEDRLDEDLIETIGNDKLITVGLEKIISSDNKESILYKKFLSPYDAVEYLKEHLKDGDVITVTGKLDYSRYADKTNCNKTITYIGITNRPQEEYKAIFRERVLIDKETFSNLKPTEDGLIELYVHSICYDNESKKNYCIPHIIYLDPNKYDNLNTVVKFLKPTKSNAVNVWGIEGHFANLTDEVDITIDDLSPDIQEMIELGFTDFDAEKEKAINSGRTKEVKIFSKPATKKNDKGVQIKDLDETTYTVDDIVYAPIKQKNNTVIKSNNDIKSTTSITKNKTNIKTNVKTNEINDIASDVDVDDEWNKLFNDENDDDMPF